MDTLITYWNEWSNWYLNLWYNTIGENATVITGGIITLAAAAMAFVTTIDYLVER